MAFVPPTTGAGASSGSVIPEVPTLATPAATATPTASQVLVVSEHEKTLHRKASHSVIERRRRNRINDQIDILKQRTPGCMQKELHKVAILEKVVEYMTALQEQIKLQEKEIQRCGGQQVQHPKVPPF